MKITVAISLVAFAAGFSASAGAADDHAGHGTMSDKMPSGMHDSMHGTASAASPMTDGLVKKVDKPGGKLTISHGPLPNGMPAMTMSFRVKDAAWLNQLKEGDRIRFATDTINGAMTVVAFERAQ